MEGSGSVCVWEGRRSERFALSKHSLILPTPQWDVSASDIHVAGQVSPGAQSCMQRSAVCERKSIRALPWLSAPLHSALPSMVYVLRQNAQSFIRLSTP